MPLVALVLLHPGGVRRFFRPLLRSASHGFAEVATWALLDHPESPLTNQAANRPVRRRATARRRGMGIRTPRDTHVLDWLATDIATRRTQGSLSWPGLADTVRGRREGLAAPPLLVLVL